MRGIFVYPNITQHSNLKDLQFIGWHLEGSFWGHINLDRANFSRSYLMGTEFLECSLNGANFHSAHMFGATLNLSNLINANLAYSNLEGASLKNSNCAGANFFQSNLIFANFNSSDFCGKEYKRAKEIGELLYRDDQILEVERKASFKGADFKTNLKHQFLRFNKDKREYLIDKRTLFLPHFIKGIIPNANLDAKFSIQLPLILGKLKKTSFLDISIGGIDWSPNRMLARYIRDQQFLYEFKRNHPKLYSWWNLTSKCGQSVPRLAFWVALVISVFAAIYYNFDVVKLLEPDKIARSWSALYTSVNIFSNLGMGDKDPLNKIGAILIMIETMLGFVALGLLLTVAGSRFARRA